jgi:hypothetical protein
MSSSMDPGADEHEPGGDSKLPPSPRFLPREGHRSLHTTRGGGLRTCTIIDRRPRAPPHTTRGAPAVWHHQPPFGVVRDRDRVGGDG